MNQQLKLDISIVNSNFEMYKDNFTKLSQNKENLEETIKVMNNILADKEGRLKRFEEENSTDKSEELLEIIDNLTQKVESKDIKLKEMEESLNQLKETIEE